MPIIKQAQTPSGVTVGYHRVIKIEGDLLSGVATALVASHSSQEDANAGKQVSYHWPLTIPLSMISGENLVDTLEQALTSQPDLPFFGGSIILDETDSLESYMGRKIAVLRQACNAQILAGFECDALGTVHTYPAKQTDQSNLAGSIIDSLIPGLPADWATPFWCADSDGVWDFRMHTAAQIQRVGQFGKGAILAAMGKNEMLTRLVLNAASKEQVAQYGWNLPIPTFDPGPEPEPAVPAIEPTPTP